MEKMILVNNGLLDDELIENLNINHFLEKLDYEEIPDTVGIAYDGELSKFVSYMTDDRGDIIYSQAFDSFEDCLFDARQAYHELCAYLNFSNKFSAEEDEKISLFLVNDMLFDDNLIELYKKCGLLTSLSFYNTSETVGIFFKDSKFIAYRTNERGRICVKKEFSSFDKALYKAREMYENLCYVGKRVSGSIARRKKGRDWENR